MSYVAFASSRVDRGILERAGGSGSGRRSVGCAVFLLCGGFMASRRLAFLVRVRVPRRRSDRARGREGRRKQFARGFSRAVVLAWEEIVSCCCGWLAVLGRAIFFCYNVCSGTKSVLAKRGGRGAGAMIGVAFFYVRFWVAAVSEGN